MNSTFILKNDGDDLVTIMTGPFLHDGSSVITQNLSYTLDTNQNYSLTVQIEYGSHVLATTTHQLGENYSNTIIIDKEVLHPYIMSDTFVDFTGYEEHTITTKSMFIVLR